MLFYLFIVIRILPFYIFWILIIVYITLFYFKLLLYYILYFPVLYLHCGWLLLLHFHFYLLFYFVSSTFLPFWFLFFSIFGRATCIAYNPHLPGPRYYCAALYCVRSICLCYLYMLVSLLLIVVVMYFYIVFLLFFWFFWSDGTSFAVVVVPFWFAAPLFILLGVVLLVVYCCWRFTCLRYRSYVMPTHGPTFCIPITRFYLAVTVAFGRVYGYTLVDGVPTFLYSSWWLWFFSCAFDYCILPSIMVYIAGRSATFVDGCRFLVATLALPLPVVVVLPRYITPADTFWLPPFLLYDGLPDLGCCARLLRHLRFCIYIWLHFTFGVAGAWAFPIVGCSLQVRPLTSRLFVTNDPGAHLYGPTCCDLCRSCPAWIRIPTTLPLPHVYLPCCQLPHHVTAHCRTFATLPTVPHVVEASCRPAPRCCGLTYTYIAVRYVTLFTPIVVPLCCHSPPGLVVVCRYIAPLCILWWCGLLAGNDDDNDWRKWLLALCYSVLLCPIISMVMTCCYLPLCPMYCCGISIELYYGGGGEDDLQSIMCMCNDMCGMTMACGNEKPCMWHGQHDKRRPVVWWPMTAWQWQRTDDKVQWHVFYLFKHLFLFKIFSRSYAGWLPVVDTLTLSGGPLVDLDDCCCSGVGYLAVTFCLWRIIVHWTIVTWRWLFTFNPVQFYYSFVI